MAPNRDPNPVAPQNAADATARPSDTSRVPDTELTIPGETPPSADAPDQKPATDLPSFILGSLSMEADQKQQEQAREIHFSPTINQRAAAENADQDASDSSGASAVPPSADNHTHRQEDAVEFPPNAPDLTIDSKDLIRAPAETRLRMRQIGRFRAIRVVGEGAFGTVFLAHDPQLDRQVALKIAKTGLMAQQRDRIRFLREARAAAQLRHPNIVPVYEFGQVEQTCYIAFQFIEGRTLKSHLRSEQKFSPQRAAELTSKLARALHYGHTQGIIHRDMKPDNVLIDDQGEPHITDFGCARRESANAARRTVHGLIMGTPSYMSPEQATGRSSRADARSDVWSLGVMLLEMLTGELPFKGSTTEVLSNVQNIEAPRLRQLDHSAPRDLETLCEKCLCKNPEGRFQTAQELADELDRWLRGEPILSRPIGSAERLWRWARRNPAVASLTMTVFLVLLLGATISTALAFKADAQARERALAQVTSLRTSSAESIPLLLQSLEPFRDDVVHSLRRELKEPLNEAQLRRVRLALYALEDISPADRAAAAQQLIGDSLDAEPEEAIVIFRVLAPHGSDSSESLWKHAQDSLEPKTRRFRAACALAVFDSADTRWQDIAGDVVGQLVVENRLAVSHWLEALAPVRKHLLPHLHEHFAGSDKQTAVAAAAVLAKLYYDDGAELVKLLSTARAEQLPELLQQVSKHPDQIKQLLASVQQHASQSGDKKDVDRAAQLANSEIALLYAGYPGPLRSRFTKIDEPTVRTLEIHRLGQSGVDPQLLKQWFLELAMSSADSETGGLELAATLLAFGQFDPGWLYISEREALAPRLQTIANSFAHPGSRSAAEWLLNRWSMPLRKMPAGSSKIPTDAKWYQNSMGNTLVIFDGVPAFLMGSDAPASGGFESGPLHQRRIPRRFAVSTREVSVAEFLQFQEDRMRTLEQRREEAVAQDDAMRLKLVDAQIEAHRLRSLNRNTATDPVAPISDVTWFEAAAYCRWLGEREGIASDQQCYPDVDVIEELFAQFQPLEIEPAALSRTGYRLPTAAEWEYACRAGTDSRYPFGALSSEYSGLYAWTLENSHNETKVTGQLLPNDAGMFDMLGNVCEWCHDWKLDLPDDATGDVIVDGTDARRGGLREVRGGSFRDLIADIHSAARTGVRPEQGDRTVGFRIARTVAVSE